MNVAFKEKQEEGRKATGGEQWSYKEQKVV